MSLILETERLQIRPWTQHDIEQYLTLANDVGYTSFSLPGQFALNPEEAKERIQDRLDLYASKKVGKFLLLSKQTGEVIGTCGFGAYEIDGREEMELGYRLRLQFWGKGYATEAAIGTLKYAFETLNLKRIFAFALPQNQASIRVIERLGGRYLRILNHADLPHALYEIARGEFQEMKSANLDSKSLVRRFWQLFSEQRWDEASTLLHKNFVAVWPQSKERIVGAKNFLDVNRYYPGHHKIEVIHVFEVDDKVLTTVWIEADIGQKTFANSIFDFKDGKILKTEEYWAEPYAAPDWRKQWVEKY
jgi:RimJ/RimL family protein N-acetyltransferase